jgi:hypothetical protein
LLKKFQRQMADQKKPPFWKNLTAGTFGGMALTLVGHPLDTIKVTKKKNKINFSGQTPNHAKTKSW